GPGYEAGVDHVDVERKIDGLGPFPGHLQCLLDNSFDPFPLDVADGKNGRPALPPNLDAGPWRLPAANPDLHEVGRRCVREIRGMEPGRGVHALVEVRFLSIDVAIEMDDTDGAIHVRSQPADSRIANRVVAAEH